MQLLGQILLMLLLLLAGAIEPGRTKNQKEPEETATFTPEQLAKAREQLSRLFDTSLDADRDGRLTQTELAAWLARAAAEQAGKDVEDSWRLLNVSEGGSVDWDGYVAASRLTRDAGYGGAAAEEDAAGRMQAEVRRAIEEASRETGIDKAGIKVSLPPAPPTKQTLATIPADAEEKQRQLALDLARERRRWLAADANGDGRLDRREYRDFAVADAGAESPRMRPVVAAEALERLDADGDGRVSEAEFLGQGPAATAGHADEDAKNFRQVWDTDKNGYLEQEEIERMLDYLDSPDTMAKEEAEAREREAAELLKAADTNADGSLSKAEVLDGLLEFVASAATNYGDFVGIHDEL